MMNAQCTMHNAQCSMLNAQCSMHNAQCSTRDSFPAVSLRGRAATVAICPCRRGTISRVSTRTIKSVIARLARAICPCRCGTLFRNTSRTIISCHCLIWGNLCLSMRDIFDSRRRVRPMCRANSDFRNGTQAVPYTMRKKLHYSTQFPNPRRTDCHAAFCGSQ